MTVSSSMSTTLQSLESPCQHTKDVSCPKVTKVTATIGNLREVLKRVEELQTTGKLPIDGKITMLTGEQSQKILQDLNALPDKPNCTNLGYVAEIFKRGLKELGLSEKAENKLFSELSKKHGIKAVALEAIFLSPSELALKHITKNIADNITQAAKASFYLSVLGDVEKILLGGVDAYWDHSRRCTLHEASVGLTKRMAEEVIGTVEYATSSIEPQKKYTYAIAQKDPARAPITTNIPPARFLPESSPSISQRSSSTAVDPGLFSWVDIEEAAEKIVDLAMDFTGVTGTIDQTKDLKKMFVTIFSDPENTPKILFDQLVQEPERMFQKIVSAPKDFIINGKAFLDDPGFTNALSIVGTIYTVISIANDILPVLSKIIEKGSKNPLCVPVVLTQEMSKLVVNKIVGVVKLAEGLLTSPLKTVEHMGKGVLKSPERLYKNIIHFGGHKKRKRKRHQAKREALRVETERQMQLECDSLKEAIIAALPPCFAAAKQQWMIEENTQPDVYLTAVIQDWKRLNTQGQFHGDCAEFIKMIHMKLEAGHFTEVYQLSPTAHLSDIAIPAVVAQALIGVAKETLEIASRTLSLGRAIEKHGTAVIEHKAEMNAFASVNRDLGAWIAEKSQQERAQEIQEGLTSEEKKARCRALLGKI